MSKCRKIVDSISATSLEDFLRSVHVNGVPLGRALPEKITDIKISEAETDQLMAAPGLGRFDRKAAEIEKKLDAVLARLDKLK